MKLPLLLTAFILGMAGLPKVAPAPAKVDTVRGLPIEVSTAARDLIIHYEVGGEAYYRKYLQRPTYPGGASGVTVGFGYDCGYNSAAQIRKDWGGRLGKAEVEALASTAGLKGTRAANEIGRVKWLVSVPWETARAVFEQSTMPRFAALTKSAFPDIASAHPHGQGAILSLSFNRGTSMSGDSRREMREIRDNLRPAPAKIPASIRSMKRLWIGKGLDGLLLRREAEAKLFEKGLSAP
jgi:hypothetical protein